MPEKENLGGRVFLDDHRGVGLGYCQASGSTAVEVTLRVSGLVCCRSLKRALAPIWNLTMPQMKESIRSILESAVPGKGPGCRLLHLYHKSLRRYLSFAHRSVHRADKGLRERLLLLCDPKDLIDRKQSELFTEPLESVPHLLELVG